MHITDHRTLAINETRTRCLICLGKVDRHNQRWCHRADADDAIPSVDDDDGLLIHSAISDSNYFQIENKLP